MFFCPTAVDDVFVVQKGENDGDLAGVELGVIIFESVINYFLQKHCIKIIIRKFYPNRSQRNF